jgi:hypothetical protein
MTNKQDDVDLIDFFTNFEEILSRDKSDVDISLLIDFQVYSNYLIPDIQEIQRRLPTADDTYLYNVCEHVFNIQDWIKLIVEDAGRLKFGEAWEATFDKYFGDKDLLRNIYDDSFQRWISGKQGQYKIGENYYNIIDDNLYYRNLGGEWFEVDRKTAFDLLPNKKTIRGRDLIRQLDLDYQETPYDLILEQWAGRGYVGGLPDNFLMFKDIETSPEEYSDFAMPQIAALLENPVSIKELERWNGGKIGDLEHMVKVALFVLETTEKRRAEDSHTLYLLRDCMMFQEAHGILDILTGNVTSSDQVLIGRKLLSHKPGQWGHYIVMLDALYTAHRRHPNDFDKFYGEFARLMDVFVESNPKFALIVGELADYVKGHIQTEKSVIDVFDIGFQGSIALLTKYLIDNHVKPMGEGAKIRTDVRIGVGAQWSKKLFDYRYDGDYFPVLNRVQLMTRNNELYYYKDGSLKDGKLRVTMGDDKSQRKAALELVVLGMIARVTQTDK